MSGKKEAPKQLRFEEAMKRLEAVVAEMESGELPLDQLLERYEEGVRLVSLCGATLDAAEQRIRTIARSATGEPVVRDGAAPVADGPDTTGNDRDVSLF